MFQERHRLAGAFAAHSAPYCATGSAPGPRPRARRAPPPPHARDLERFSPQPRAASTAITGLYVEHQSIWEASHTHQMEALQTDEQITPITTIKRHRAAAGRVRHRPRSLKAAGEQVRSSSRTSTSTRNPQPTSTHPHSTRKSPFSRAFTARRAFIPEPIEYPTIRPENASLIAQR